ncbi:MAG: nickel-binding protein [Candidatus Limnocylindrales bacterium]
MATFLIETYLPRCRAGDLAAATSSLRAVAFNAPPDEQPVRYVRSFFVPEDEMAFHVIEAPSLEATAELSRRAGLSPERIVETEASGG